MHEILEDICHYNMCHLIIYYTEKIEIFSLETLNFRKQHFSYELELKNLSLPNEKEMVQKKQIRVIHLFLSSIK